MSKKVDARIARSKSSMAMALERLLQQKCLTDITVNDITDQYSQLKGDINADGTVDVGDVNAVLDAILAGSNDAKFDINGDGKVDVGDVNAVLGYILSK